ncbi:unnamed protein product [marine sediment metagenome]|uniref:Uncharacterized protein n=1 Tax=marine sediment metagenome TaxID=412755 RepID=X0S7E8_9ZZZZ
MNKSTTPATYFDPNAYITSLMEDIGFSDASGEEKEQMYKGLSEQTSHLILNAVSLYVEPEQIDEALVQHGDLNNLAEFIKKLVEISPEAQLAILEALDGFYAEIVETYEHFKTT